MLFVNVDTQKKKRIESYLQMIMSTPHGNSPFTNSYHNIPYVEITKSHLIMIV